MYVIMKDTVLIYHYIFPGKCSLEKQSHADKSTETHTHRHTDTHTHTHTARDSHIALNVTYQTQEVDCKES